ncbi:multidrug transporter AcrB [Planctomycetota bacterium]|nr:multidrug transporter AcrB [Planctomycetota bacterium]
MLGLTELCIRKPVAAWMLLLAVVGIGAVAVSRIGVSLFPDVDRPSLSINTNLPGAAPEVIERNIVQPMEQALAQAEGVVSISSECRRGSARLTVDLSMSRDVDDALQDIQNRLSSIARNLPRDMDPVQIRKSNPEDDELMWIGLSGTFSPQLLSDTALYVVGDRIQAVSGVGEISLRGVAARNLRIWLDAERLAAADLTASEVAAAVGRNHIELPAGQVSSGTREIGVRVFGEAANVAAFRELVVANRNGRAVRLDDVALVEDGFEDQRRLFRIDGVPGVGIGVRKQRGANAVQVAAEVTARVDQLRGELPAGMGITVLTDNSTFISDSVHEMWRELITAVILTALVCWLFLGSLVAAFNVLLAIPMSLLGTIAVLQALGMTLNTFTMLGLALAIGLVVDDAIMVQENIQRHREMGRTAIAAARRGTREIFGAALAATAAVIAIFSPVLFMSGEIGRYFLQFGLALSIAVALSLVEAVTLAPARLAYLYGDHSSERGNWFGRVVDAAFAGLGRVYAVILGWSLRWPWLTLAVTALICSAGWFAALNLRNELLPPQDSGRLGMRFQTPVGSDFDESARVMTRVEAVIAAEPAIRQSMTVLFNNTSGFCTLDLKPKRERPAMQVVMDRLRTAVLAVPGVASASIDDGAPQLIKSSGAGGQRRTVEVVFRGGNDWEELARSASAFRTALAADKERFRNVGMDYRPGQPEIQIIPDRDRASDLGVSMQDIATTLNSMIGSVRVGTIDLGGRQQDIRMRLRADQRATPEDLGRILVRARGGKLVPLSAVVKIEERPVPMSLFRRDRERVITVRADNGPALDEAQALTEALALVPELPKGIRATTGSDAAALANTMRSLGVAFIFGVIASYLVLAAQYNALSHPVVILAILPMAVAGGTAALWLAGASLSAFSGIGVLLLMGIAKKNSILLVDFARQRQLDDPTTTPAAAMLQAGAARLRPILMTSLATLMAAVPIALGTGPGSETRAPMAVAVLGGVALSTALSLVAVPACYQIAERFTGWLRRLFLRPTSEAAASPGRQDEGAK